MNEKQLPTDVEIIQQVLKGQQHAFGLLMTRYEPAFLRYAMQYTKDEDDAADVVQEAFIKIFRNLSAFQQHRTFSSWAYRIVRNESLNWLRARRRLTFGETAEYILGQLFAASSPDMEYAHVETQTRLKSAFAAMPQQYVEPLKLHFLEQRSYKEISTALKIPIGTVGTRINRAKSQLKQLWQKSETHGKPRTG